MFVCSFAQLPSLGTIKALSRNTGATVHLATPFKKRLIFRAQILVQQHFFLKFI